MTPVSRDTSAAVPTISGKSDIGTQPQPSYYRALVVIHALFLGVSFVIVFPLGVIGLRFGFRGAFHIHWILQSLAATACLIGLILAITLSVTGIEYSSFSEAHQIIGIIAVAVLLVQAPLGYRHHQMYKAIGARTWVSHLHLWIGRSVIVLGMVNTVL